MADREFIEQQKTHIENTLSSLEPVSDGMSQKEQAGTATFLMNIYSGIENILRIIIEEDTGEKIRKSEAWHKELLAKSVEKGVISAGLKDVLMEYLKFRHLHIHGYGYMLEWEEFRSLAINARATVEKFFNEMKNGGYCR